MAFSPDSRTLAMYDQHPPSPNMVRFWNLAGDELKETSAIPGFQGPLDFSQDGKKFICGISKDNANLLSGIQLWDVSGGKPVKTTEFGGDCWNSSLVFAPDGKTVLQTEVSGKTRIWNITPAKPARPPHHT